MMNKKSIRTKEQVNKDNAPSNEYVLNVAFLSFIGFMILQGSFAIVAKSESMFADTCAMSVDAFTYLFNLAAERLKHKTSMLGNTEGLSSEDLKRRRKMFRLYLEFVPPLMSVTALIIVSAQTMMDATHTIMYGAAEDKEDGDEPNVNLMLFFSALNLCLDIMNVTCFAKAKNFSGPSIGGMVIQTVDSEDDGLEEDQTEKLSSDDDNSNKDTRIGCDIEVGRETDSLLKKTSNGTEETTAHCYGSEESLVSVSDCNTDDEGLSEDEDHKSSYQQQRSQLSNEKIAADNFSEGTDDDSNISEASSSDSTNGLNLNMCSAYTHVMADTLRSIAVLVAAGIAFRFKTVSPAMADASAAVVVSIIIALSLGPLLAALVRTFRELVELRREESIAREGAKSSTDCQTIWMEEYQSLPYGIQT